MAKGNVNKGSLVFVPKVPLAFWSRLGDPAFWNVGLVINKIDDGFIVIYSCDEKIEKIHSKHVREVM